MPLEIEIIRLFNSHPQLDSFFITFGFITAHIFWLLVFLHMFKKDRQTACAYGISLLLLVAAVLLLKELIGRPRPAPEMVRSVVMVSTYAFPSMHAAMSVYTAVFAYTATFVHNTLHDRRFTVFLVLIAILVCIDRLALGVHYPSDLIGGALLGYLVALITMRFMSCRH